jgi:lipopolysaccharide export system permease protein
VQRFEHDRPDPTIVVFERYAFDLSQFERTPIIQYNFREHFLWQLAFPEQELTPAQRNAIRAELHDRLMAPLYPVAFVIIAYAYLGAPRTTRQSRSLSLLGAIGMVALVRLSGFVSTTVGAQVPAVLLVQYVAVALAIALGLLAIGKGVIIEPPAFINNAIAVVVERIGRRLARPAAAPS